MDEVRTERLVLRRWRDDDLDGLAEMNSDPEVMRFLHDGAPMTREESAEQLAGFMRHWQEHGFGLWAAVLPETAEVIGFVGLAVPTFLPEVLPAVEVGWRLERRHWGNGYATEGGGAALRFGFEDLGLDRIVSVRHRDNEASRRGDGETGDDARAGDRPSCQRCSAGRPCGDEADVAPWATAGFLAPDDLAALSARVR